jgi:hypothetical protein
MNAVAATVVPEPSELELRVAEAMRRGDRVQGGPKGRPIDDPRCHPIIRRAFLRRARHAIEAMQGEHAPPEAQSERADVDRLLYQLGLNPDECRTPGGILKVNHILRELRRPAEAFAWVIPYPTGLGYWRDHDQDGPRPNQDSHHLAAEPFPLFRRVQLHG